MPTLRWLALGSAQTFGYDPLDRLTQQQLGTETLDYSYDANSNRTSLSRTSGTTTTTTASPIEATSNRITSRNSTTFQYLPTGQIARDEARIYSYDHAGRLSMVQNGLTSLSNVYDPLGQRIKKVSGSTVTYFVYDEAGQLLGEYNGAGAMLREYVWLGNRVVGLLSAQQPGKLLQVHTDHLGTVRAVSDGNTVLWRWEGDQFGDVLPTEDIDNNGQTFTMPLRHPGQYYDTETGLFYNYYRDYDPASGRYVESDPVGLRGGVNTYGYVGGRPLSWSDPLGLMSTLDDCGGKNAEACAEAGIIPKPLIPRFPKDLLPYKNAIEDICKGKKGRDELSDEVREAAAYYRKVAESVDLTKKNGDVAQKLNNARADYLSGKTNAPPGQSGNFK